MTTMTADGPSDVQDFSRYEFKYLLDAGLRAEVESEISHFMSYDGYVHPELENCYIVRSLYFDNDSGTNFYQKIDGMKTRRKYRLRTYGKEPGSEMLFFLEEKGRHNERTYKHRIRIDPGDLSIFCTPSQHFELLDRYPDVPLVGAFVYDSVRRKTQPKVLVDYLRRPYKSEFDINFRVTFDNDLTATPAATLFPDESTASWRASDAGYTILEIKFHRRVPAWFHRILQAYNMRRLSISKFCRGMEVCNLAVNLS